MALFHFRLKSDKKQSGAKVSAVKHVEYINREGTFAHEELGKQNNKFVGDFITTAQTPNVLGGSNTLLYKTDDFGSIRNTERGLEVTKNASLTTISFALMLADKTRGHKPLLINCSAQFRKKVLEATEQANLHISFQNKLLQREIERRRKLTENDRRKFIAGGGRIISKRPNPKPHICPAYSKTVEEATQKGLALPTLADLSRLKSLSSKGELNPEEARDMEDFLQEPFKHFRTWSISTESKRTQIAVVVSFTLIICRSGRTTIRKYFLKRQTNTKE